MKNFNQYITEKIKLSNDRFAKKPFNAHTHKYVDLGLPSGNIWATEPCGGYKYYLWATDIDVSSNRWNDDKSALNLKMPPKFDFDTCRAIMHGDWSVPSVEDYQELIDNCEIEPGDECVIFTGPNGNELIFGTNMVYCNAGDHFSADEELADQMGLFWTRDLSKHGSEYAVVFFIDTEEPHVGFFDSPNTGLYEGNQYGMQIMGVIHRK
jgi:hypothetical protein